MSEQFNILFTSSGGMRQVRICPEEIQVDRRPMSYYQVYMQETYLFSLCPVVDRSGSKCWELIEKDRADYLPSGFVPFLGSRIDDYFQEMAKLGS